MLGKPRLILLVTLMLFLSSLALNPAASARPQSANYVCTQQQITDNAYVDSSPKIDKGMVVWQGDDGTDDEIFLWDGATTTQLTNNSTDDLNPHIHNGKVVWRGDDGTDFEIYLWDGVTTIQLTNNDAPDFSPKIDNGMVVWDGNDGADTEIYLWDGVSVNSLTNNAAGDSFPQIDNGLVAWNRWDGTDYDVFLWDGNSTTQLTNNSTSDLVTQIDNGLVVWHGNDGTDNEIYLWDGNSTNNISNNSINDWQPRIDNGNVVWESDDGSDRDIQLWNGTSVNQLTVNTGDDKSPNISNDLVVWHGHDGTDDEIFMWDGVTVTQLTDNTTNDQYAEINNGLIAWRRNDGTDDEIFIAECYGNDWPVAVDDSYSTPVNTALNVPAPGVLENDTDANSNALTAMLMTDPANGMLTLNDAGSFTYTPDTDYIGQDSFTYRAYDGMALSNLVTVTITVSTPPVAVDDTYNTPGNTALSVGSPGVLSNDTDAESDPLTAVLDSTTTSGTLILNPDGSFDYTPDTDFTGDDTFTYHANDGATDSNIATVTITVNTQPVAVDDLYGTLVNTALNISTPGVLSNDSDADGHTLTAALDATTTNGTLTPNGDGSFTYTPDTDFVGVDSFTYQANDGLALSNLATVSIIVGEPGDVPTNLAVSGNDAVPVLPTFDWLGVTGASEYRIYLQTADGTKVMDETFATGDICTNDVICSISAGDYISIPAWGLTNDTYEWWVAAQLASDWDWSGGANFDAATFTVSVPDTALPDPVTVNPGDGRVAVYFPDDANTLWVNLWIGPHPDGSYYEWLSRDILSLGGTTQDEFTCDGTICTAYPEWDVTSASGLTAWMQAWGPAGFSSGGTAEPLAPSWNQMSATVDGAGVDTPATTFDLPADAPAAPTNIGVVDATAVDPVVTWTGAANSTWYNVVIYNPANNAIPVNEWFVYQNTDLNCMGKLTDPADYECALGGLGLNSLLTSGATYQIWMRSWGPSGFGTGATDLAPNWNMGEFTYTPA